MQLAWSRIWTRVAVSISYDDKNYTTGTSKLFLLLTKMYGWKSQRQLSCTNRSWSTNLWWNLSWFRWKPSGLYNNSDVHTNSHGHISFSLLSTQHIWSCFLLECHPHNLHSISTRNTCILFTLGTGCLSSYFCSQCPISRATSTC